MKLLVGYILAAVLVGANAYGRQHEGYTDQSSMDAQLESSVSSSRQGRDGRFNDPDEVAHAEEFIKTVFGETKPAKSQGSNSKTAVGR